MARTRKSIVAIVLVALIASLAALVGMRKHGVLLADRASEPPPGTGKSDESTDATRAPKKAAAKPGAKDVSDKVKADATLAVKAPPPPLDRPLRVVSLGWDLAVPGHLANLAQAGEKSAAAARDLTVVLTSVAKLSAIKEALANGGADPKGADIAIVSLPEMVASYEDLRALKPQIFFIVGWSRGRDALVAHGKASLTAIPRRGEIGLAGERGQAATLLALFLLDSAGANLDRIRLRAPASSKPAYTALDRTSSAPLQADTRIAVTSADASALIPYVAIAPEGFLSNQRATRTWIAAWLEGVRILERDVPAAARRIAALPGAPPTVDLVRRLGLIEFSDLHDNVRRAGLTGRDPVTISRLFTLTWRLWRDVDVLTTPAPSNVPLSFDAITSLILESPESAPEQRPKLDFTAELLLRSRTSTDLSHAALLAGVFARSGLRIGAQNSARRTADAIEELATRYGLHRARFEAKPELSTRKTVTLEILGVR